MITWDEVDAALTGALPWLSVTVFPTLLIGAVVFGTEWYRLGDENVHDVDDYKPTPEPVVVWPRRRMRRPQPSQTPIHDRLAAEPMPNVVARRIANQWLEDLAAVEQAKAGIRPAYDPARDMTGAFPVVRAA